MKKQDAIEQLKKIKQVEAPSFLLTRIEAAIEPKQTQVFKQWLSLGALAFAVLLFANVYLINTNSTSSNLVDKTSLSVFDYSTENQLYYD